MPGVMPLLDSHMNLMLTAKKRKCLIGLSSPVNYNPHALRKKFPTALLEAPAGLFLLFDEIWFLHTNLCPWNMRQLPYVHFLNEEINSSELSGLVKEIPKAAAKSKQELTAGQIQYTNLSFVQPPPIIIGESTLEPSPLRLENFIIDSALASYFDLNLITNSITNPSTSPLIEVNREKELAHLLLLNRIPNIYGKWGPHRPGLRDLIDDLRESELLRSFREKISEACKETSATPISELSQKIEKELDDIVYASFSDSFRKRHLYFSFANMLLGQIPVVSNVLSVIMGISDFVKFYRTRNNSGWAGFIAYAKNHTGSSYLDRK